MLVKSIEICVVEDAYEIAANFLVPELQRRGRFRREYTGQTLRENLSA